MIAGAGLGWVVAPAYVAETRTCAMTKTNSTTPPWERKNPKSDDEHAKLTPTERARAKKSAEAAGRPYPNLVDNMRVAKKKGEARKAKS
jgi:hypothetical protein